MAVVAPSVWISVVVQCRGVTSGRELGTFLPLRISICLTTENAGGARGVGALRVAPVRRILKNLRHRWNRTAVPCV